MLQRFGQLVAARQRFAMLMVLLAGLLMFFIYPLDERLLASLHFWHHRPEQIAHTISFALGTWGDYPTYNLPLAVLIWLYGVRKKSSAWRRVAVACFLGATLAGLFDDCFRLTLGRPRPDAHVPDGFYGLACAFQSRYQSFPSGHAASVISTAVSLLFVCRPLGFITTAYALAVIWARMELNRHYPSDVAVGAVIGIYFGTIVGWAARPPRLSVAATPRHELVAESASKT